MLDDLVQVIGILKDRVRDHRSDLTASETRTRMALIDPLLTTLGWNTSDPALVTPEYSVKTRRADYALKTTGPTPAMFIEAKKLGEGVEPHREQMTNYSNMAGVRYAALTDGDRWEVYEVFKQAPLDERRVVELSISRDPAHECALKLLLLWRPNMESGSPIPANEPGLMPEPRPNPPPEPAPNPPPHSPQLPIAGDYDGTSHKAYLLLDTLGVRLEDGRLFGNPHKAAKAIKGRRTTHSWSFWKYESSPGVWRPIRDLRDELRSSAT